MQGKVIKVPLKFYQRFFKNILFGNTLLLLGILISSTIDWNYSVLINVIIGIAIAVGVRMGLLTFALDQKDHRQFIQWLRTHPDGKIIFYRRNKKRLNQFIEQKILPVLSKKVHRCNQHRGTVAPHIRRQFFMFKTTFKRPLLIIVAAKRNNEGHLLDQDKIDYFTTTFIPLKKEVEKAMKSDSLELFKQL